MKTINRILISGISLLIVLASYAQEKDVYMTFKTWKYTDNSRALIAELTTDGEEDEIPAAGIFVDFYTVSDTGEILIDKVMSDQNGISRLQLPDGLYIFKDDEGYMQFLARSQVNDIFWSAEEELAVKDIIIDFSFELIDSVKTVAYQGIVLGNDGEEMPLADDEVYFYVPRMFSDLKIEDGWFEEDGTGMFEYPLDIIGDTLGVVEVIARIEEHFDYGYVEKRHSIDWAVPNHLIYAEGPTRELWTPIAPLWMIITLIVMLVGVWGHYFYAMYQLYKIRQLGKKSKSDN